MLCYGFLNKRSPLAVLRFPAQTSPLAPSGSGSLQSISQSMIIKYGVIPIQSSMTQPIAFLISKQVVPYQTCCGTCCPGVSTPKIQSLADSSMTNHITWWNPTISTISTHAQTTASILTTVTSHHDGWKTKTLNNNISQTQHHKYGKTYDNHDYMAKYN
jgi:hypothetical protein